MQQLKKSVTGKYDSDAVDALLEKMKKEFEETSSSQKQRIVELRDENTRLREELGDVEEKKSVLLTAMLTAQRTSRELMDAAKQQADDLIASAEERERRISESVREHREMLLDVKQRCQNILASINAELEREAAPPPAQEKPQSQPVASRSSRRKLG